MVLYAWEAGDRPVWLPLERFATVTTLLHSGRLRPDDFMYMGRVRAEGLPAINLYKHYDTRRYLNLDGAGHAYRFLGIVDDGSRFDDVRSVYECWRDPRSSIEHLELELLDRLGLPPQLAPRGVVPDRRSRRPSH